MPFPTPVLVRKENWPPVCSTKTKLFSEVREAQKSGDPGSTAQLYGLEESLNEFSFSSQRWG